jgi:hypothetical protein
MPGKSAGWRGPLLPLPARGERVGVRGSLHVFGLAESPPHPDFSLRVKSDLSPQAGRGDLKATLAAHAKCKKPPVGQISVQPRSQKYFASAVAKITSIALPSCSQRGGSRSSRTRSGMRWTRQRRRAKALQGGFPVSEQPASRRTALMRTAKSCGPDAPTLASRLRRQVGPTGFDAPLIRKRRRQKSPVTGESAKQAVKTIARGEPAGPVNLW